MTFIELCEARDRRIKEYLKDNMLSGGILSEDVFKKAAKLADERMAKEFPDVWARWLEKKDFPIAEPRFSRFLKFFGITLYPRRANIALVIEEWRYVQANKIFHGMFESMAGKKLDKFTYEELMLFRQCYIAEELGLNPRLILN